MITITAPERGFSGRIGDVEFADGRAEVDPRKHAGALHYMRRHGYGIGGPPRATRRGEFVHAPPATGVVDKRTGAWL